jgi:hypothetical protein
VCEGNRALSPRHNARQVHAGIPSGYGVVNRLLTFIVFSLFSANLLTAQIAAKQIYQHHLLEEYRLHPILRLEDMYKFIHQSAMGPAHWGMDSVMVMQYLSAETKNLVPDKRVSSLQYLTPDSTLVRVHLHPYLFQNGDINSLGTAFLATAKSFQPDTARMKIYIDWFLELVLMDRIKFDMKRCLAFFDKMKTSHYPAIDHSQRYTKMYAPAYRVVLKKYIPFTIY